MLGVEGRIALRDGVEAGGDRRARLRDALPALGRIDRPAAGFGGASPPRPGSATTLSLVEPRTASRAE